jgi:hypothetical protein
MIERALRKNEIKYPANKKETVALPQPRPTDAPVLNAQKLSAAPSPMEINMKKTWKALRDIQEVGRFR